MTSKYSVSVHTLWQQAMGNLGEEREATLKNCHKATIKNNILSFLYLRINPNRHVMWEATNL